MKSYSDCREWLYQNKYTCKMAQTIPRLGLNNPPSIIVNDDAAIVQNFANLENFLLYDMQAFWGQSPGAASDPDISIIIDNVTYTFNKWTRSFKSHLGCSILTINNDPFPNGTAFFDVSFTVRLTGYQEYIGSVGKYNTFNIKNLSTFTDNPIYDPTTYPYLTEKILNSHDFLKGYYNGIFAVAGLAMDAYSLTPYPAYAPGAEPSTALRVRYVFTPGYGSDLLTMYSAIYGLTPVSIALTYHE